MPKRPSPPTATYQGPACLDADIGIAMDVLDSSLTVTATAHDSHTCLQIEGFGTDATLTATAVYLVGSIAQCIQSNLAIRKALFDDASREADLDADVRNVIGSRSADELFKTTRRDPWIWEGISHLIVHLSRRSNDFHPSGQVLVKTHVKYDVHDHGLDLIALYDAGDLGITAGESKAYLDDPSTAITDAANRLSEVDRSLRDAELRATVNQLRPALTSAQTKKLGGAFWRKERTYYPFVCCDEDAAVDWTKSRKALGRLEIPVAKRMLVPFTVPKARRVFDTISSRMRRYARGTLTA